MDRSTTAVSLEPITEHNVGAVCALRVAPDQERFVAANVTSLAEAYAEYDIAWPRAIARAGELVGRFPSPRDRPRGRRRTPVLAVAFDGRR
jgi:diamine N-acetyltransferase